MDDKSIALDVRVRLASGEQIDVEMQSQRRPAQRERSLYYWARLYAGQLRRGASYTDLRRCVVILITNYSELATARFHSRFRLRQDHGAEVLTDQLEIHLLELPKLRNAAHQNDEPNLTAWGNFLLAASDEDLETLAMENPVLKQAKDALDRLSADDEARMRAEQREMAEISYALDMGAMRRQGIASVVQHLLTVKFGELAPGVQERLVGASEPELQRWSERLLSATSLEDVFAGPR